MNYSLLCADVRAQRPLIHCISNIVSANDCANLALTVGASPIMAQAPEETAHIAALASALVLNTGTPDAQKFPACRNAMLSARKKGIPVVLDPVGIGASPWRAENIFALLSCGSPDIMRVNASEALTLLGLHADEHGVDNGSVNSDNEALAVRLASEYHCTVLLSGTDDFISDSHRTVKISGGSGRMRNVTGAGCMLTVLCGVFAAVEKDYFTACVCASRFWKDCAEAADKAPGAGSYHAAIFDAAEKLSGES